MLAVKNSRTRWAVAESGEKRAGSWPGEFPAWGLRSRESVVGRGGHKGGSIMNDKGIIQND